MKRGAGDIPAEIRPFEPDMYNYSVGKMFDKYSFIGSCKLLRERAPLVHCITNYVAMDFNANALLAVGASPLMSFYPQEMPDLASACSSLLVNIGCLDAQQSEAMRSAVICCGSAGKPWVLDPVGAGVTRLRMEICEDLISLCAPAVIRGNASEIMALAGARGVRSNGVDSREDIIAASESATALSKRTGSVVSVSGPIDFITDGEHSVRIANGSPRMTGVTAMGCTASALTAAFAAVSEPFEAAVSAMALMGVVGERAAKSSGGALGSLRTFFLDELSTLDPEEAFKEIRICV